MFRCNNSCRFILQTAALCADVLRLHGREKRIGGWDLLWDDGIVLMEETTQDAGIPTVSTPNSFLGRYTQCFLQEEKSGRVGSKCPVDFVFSFF